MTFFGVKGYRPVVATLKETPVAICYEFKEGNDNGGRLQIVKRALSKIPCGKKIELIVLDSEYYCSDVIEYLERKKVPWSITAGQDQSTKQLIKSLRWLLVEVGGKLIRHGRSLILKIAASLDKYRLYLEMRRKMYELLLE
jgi:hypothetical protein